MLADRDHGDSKNKKGDPLPESYYKDLTNDDRNNIEYYIQNELKETLKYIKWAAKSKHGVLQERVIALTQFHFLTFEASGPTTLLIRRNIHLFNLKEVSIKNNIVSLTFLDHHLNLLLSNINAIQLIHSLYAALGNPKCKFQGVYNDLNISTSTLSSDFQYNASRSDSFIECFYASCSYFGESPSRGTVSSVLSILHADYLIFNVSEVKDLTVSLYKSLMKTLSFDQIIKILYINRVFIGDDHISYLMNTLSENKSIESLKLSGAGVSFLIGDHFGRLLSNHPGSTLHSLDLSNTPLGDNGVMDLCRGLKEHQKSFLYLNFANCSLTSLGLCALFETFATYNPILSANISFLNLSNNQFDKKQSLKSIRYETFITLTRTTDVFPPPINRYSGTPVSQTSLQINTSLGKKRGSFATVSQRILPYYSSIPAIPHNSIDVKHRKLSTPRIFARRSSDVSETSSTRRVDVKTSSLRYLILSSCDVDITLLISRLMKLPSVKLETLDLSFSSISDEAGLLLTEYFATYLSSTAFYFNIESCVLKPSVMEGIRSYLNNPTNYNSALVASLIHRQIEFSNIEPLSSSPTDSASSESSKAFDFSRASIEEKSRGLTVDTSHKISETLTLASPRIRPQALPHDKTRGGTLGMPSKMVNEYTTVRRGSAGALKPLKRGKHTRQRLIFNLNNVGSTQSSTIHILSLLSTCSTSLKSLLLNKIDIDKESTILLFNVLSQLPALELFSFDFNIRTEDADESVADALEDLVNSSRSLSTLSIRGNWKSNFQAPVLKMVESLTLASSFHLKRLDISGNGIGPALAESLGRVIQHNASLKEFHWDNNLTSSTSLFLSFLLNSTLLISSPPIYDISRIKKKKSDGSELDTMVEQIKSHIEANRRKALFFSAIQSPFSYELYARPLMSFITFYRYVTASLNDYRHIDFNIVL